MCLREALVGRPLVARPRSGLSLVFSSQLFRIFFRFATFASSCCFPRSLPRSRLCFFADFSQISPLAAFAISCFSHCWKLKGINGQLSESRPNIICPWGSFPNPPGSGKLTPKRITYLTTADYISKLNVRMMNRPTRCPTDCQPV